MLFSSVLVFVIQCECDSNNQKQEQEVSALLIQAKRLLHAEN